MTPRGVRFEPTPPHDQGERSSAASRTSRSQAAEEEEGSPGADRRGVAKEWRGPHEAAGSKPTETQARSKKKKGRLSEQPAPTDFERGAC